MPGKKISDFKVNEVVWVKLGSYPWWPARVALQEDGKIYKGKKLHVIFFGDDTEAWIDLKKVKTPFADHLEEHSKSKKVATAVEEAKAYVSESAGDADIDDGADAETGSADDGGGGTTAGEAAADTVATEHDEQAANAETSMEVDNGSSPTVASAAGGDDAKQDDQVGNGDGDKDGTGGDDDDGDENDDEDDEDNDDDDGDGDDDDDDDSELSLSEGSDDEPAFEPKPRKSTKPAAKRKASTRGAPPSAKRSRSDGGAVRRAPKEKSHDDPVPEAELRDAPVTELVSLRTQADEAISSFAEASTVVSNISASRLKLQAKLDKLKKQEKQANKLQQDAKTKIRKALKEVAGCKMTVSALQETRWGKTVKKLSKFDADANISKIADAQLNRWKATVSVANDASSQTAEKKQDEPQNTDHEKPSPKPAAVDKSVQPEPAQKADGPASQGNGSAAGSSTAVDSQEQTSATGAPPANADAEAEKEAEAEASEKLRAKARNLLAQALGLSPDCEPTVAETAKETAIGREIEAEIFRIHGPSPKNMDYKMRFRTLRLALQKNESLRHALLTGEATPARVAVDENLLN